MNRDFAVLNGSYGDILNHEEREGHEVLIADFIDLTTDFSGSGGLAGLAFFGLDLLQSEL